MTDIVLVCTLSSLINNSLNSCSLVSSHYTCTNKALPKTTTDGICAFNHNFFTDQSFDFDQLNYYTVPYF